jgi:hypothetical protein
MVVVGRAAAVTVILLILIVMTLVAYRILLGKPERKETTRKTKT